MSNQIAGHIRKALLKVVVFVLLAAQAALVAPQPVLAAPTFTVSSAADVAASAPLNNGVCETAPGNDVCTLRAAIMKANHFPGGGVTINIPSGTYTLTIPKSGPDDETTGNLNITASMSLTGVGATSALVDGNGSATNDNMLFVDTGVTVTISNVTFRNGRGGLGGGIITYGDLTLNNSVVSANNTGHDGAGGGIFNQGGILTLNNSVVSGNNTDLGGGGIYGNGGSLTLTNSVVSGNNSNFNGGGISNYGTLALSNSTISGNNALQYGGGIYNDSTLHVINSTISGNNSARDGGGIFNLGTSNLFNTTIAFNQADSDFNGTGMGGGVRNEDAFFFTNSLIALNSETVNNGLVWVPVDGDCAGIITSQGFSILNNYDASHCTVNGSFTLVDPQLGPLQNNGGATQTHALLAGSAAIDAGDNTLGGCKDYLGATLVTDQRGAARPVDGGLALRCDIGAYEYLAKIPQSIAFGALANKTVGDPSFSVSATATSGLAVTFTAAGPCNVSGSLATLAGTGTCTVTAHQTGDSNYNAAPDAPQSFTISVILYLPLIAK